MELKNTIEAMTSDDHKKRFLAEYQQLKIRIEKLDKIIVAYKAGTLDFELNCPIELLRDQKQAMENYLFLLKVRAEFENITLEG